MTDNHSKFLFILKKRSAYSSWGEYPYGGKSSGLSNSARFVSDMLVDNGISSEVIEVDDNNFIDRAVVKHKPSIVIIEAFWVVPEKFAILKKLHPKVKWVIRNHSNWPFGSTEGNLIDWAMKYVSQENVYVSCNKQETSDSFRKLVQIANPDFSPRKVIEKTPFLPNYYPDTTPLSKTPHCSNELHIGNFGAIRVLKNNLIQAMAALIFADKIGKNLVFHINGSRIEGRGEPVAKSVVTLFDHFPNAKLIDDGWKSHEDFLQLCADMDIVMQTAFDETFNIVVADAVSMGTAVVGSKEIPWLSDSSIVENITDVQSIVDQLYTVYNAGWFDRFFKSNKRGLRKYVNNSKKLWLKWANSN